MITKPPQGETSFALDRRDLDALLYFLAVETTFAKDAVGIITRKHVYDIGTEQAAEMLFRIKYALQTVVAAVADMEAQLNQPPKE